MTDKEFENFKKQIQEDLERQEKFVDLIWNQIVERSKKPGPVFEVPVRQEKTE